MDPTLWSRASEHLENELGRVRVRRWLPETRCSLRGNVAVLEAPAGEPLERLEENLERVQAVLSDLAGRPIRARVSQRRGSRARAARPASEPLILESEQIARRGLGSYFVGPSNRLAAAFARQAVEEPGAWHPLLFHGDVGTGKTHLLQAIVSEHRRRSPGKRAVYVRSKQFSAHFSQALKTRQLPRFHDHYREAGLLVIDDLDDLGGKPASARELSHVLDHYLLRKQGAQVVLAGRRAPKAIAQLHRGLEARLLGGQVVPLETPDCETRRHVLRAACMKRGLVLAQDVEDYLATKVELSVQELIASATRLQAHHEHVGARLDLSNTRRVLADLIDARQDPATIDALAAYVAEQSGVSLELLCGRSRQASAIRARALAVGLTRTLTKLTLREVGAFFGGRAPNSVHGAQAQARELRAKDPKAAELWERAERRFRPA